MFEGASFKLKGIKGGSLLFVYILDPSFSLVASSPMSVLLGLKLRCHGHNFFNEYFWHCGNKVCVVKFFDAGADNEE